MSLDVIIKIYIYFFNVTFAIVPDWHLPYEIVNGINGLIERLLVLQGIVPIADLLIVVLSIVGLELSILFGKIVIGSLAMIRGSGKIDL